MARWNRHALARMTDVLQQHIDAGRLPGAVAAVAADGQLDHLVALGRLDPAREAPMGADAIFRIYSMTKPIVSLATLMLAEQGRLQLVDPIAKYLPVFADTPVAVEADGAVALVPQARPATVHDLLRHTAGFTYEFLGAGTVQRQYEAARLADRSRSNAQFCEALAQLPLVGQPGAGWEYSRATDVLGAVLEVAAGQPLPDLLRAMVLAPLGMHETAFHVPPDQAHRVAEPFAACPETGAAVHLLDPLEEPVFASGGGGLMSTAADYLRFLALLQGRGSLQGVRLLGRKTLDWMTADHLGSIPARGDMLPPGHGFGLGFAVRLATGLGPQPGSPGMYFWSGIGGTSFFVDPAENIAALLLTQAPNQRVYYRNLFRHLVYAALE